MQPKLMYNTDFHNQKALSDSHISNLCNYSLTLLVFKHTFSFGKCLNNDTLYRGFAAT